jgi:hypothetical protein
MGNAKYTTEDCVIEMRSTRIAKYFYDVEKDETQSAMTVERAYQIARTMAAQVLPGHKAGYSVNDLNQLVPITEPKPRSEAKLKPVSIEALAAADGVVADAEVHDEPEVDAECEQECEPDAEPTEPEHTQELSESGWAASGAEAEDGDE